MKYTTLQQLYSGQFYFNNQLLNNVTDRKNRPVALRDEEGGGVHKYDSLHRSAETDFNVLEIITILGVEFC